MKPALLFLIAIAAQAQPVIREEQTIEVNGVRESWRLQWKSPPKPACDAGNPEWFTCPCAGFAFGETGSLDLVRLRQGREVERLPLTPLFDGKLIVQRFAVVEKDMDDPDSEALPAIVARRPAVRLMNFADYDHDGHATEFYLQTMASPCGHAWGAVIGVSSSNPKLHAFATTARPRKVLLLEKPGWDALLNAHGAIHIVNWQCGDHGDPNQSELQMQVTPGGIDIIREIYICPRLENARPVKKEPYDFPSPP